MLSAAGTAQSIWTKPFKKANYDFDKGYEIRLGANIGYFVTGEIGFAKSAWTDQTHGSGKFSIHEMYRVSYSASCEYNFRPKHTVIAPKLSFTYGGQMFVHFGISALYGTDLSKGTVYLRPQVGYSLLQYVEFSYGYNIPVSRNDMKGQMNTHVFGITGYIPVFRKEYQYRYEKDYRLK